MVKGSLVSKDCQQSPGNREESGCANFQAQPQYPPYTGSNTDRYLQPSQTPDGRQPQEAWVLGPTQALSDVEQRPWPPPPSRETPAWHSHIPLAGVDTPVSDQAAVRLRTTPRPLAPVATGWEAGGRVRGQA